MPEPDIAGQLSQKKRVIRICLSLAMLSFAGMFALIHWGMSDADARQQVIDICVRNGPTAPTWPQQLNQYGLKGKGDAVIRPYCQCMWTPTLAKMSVSDIKAFFNKTPREQIQVLGGQQAMTEHNKQCMLQVKSTLQ